MSYILKSFPDDPSPFFYNTHEVDYKKACVKIVEHFRKFDWTLKAFSCDQTIVYASSTKRDEKRMFTFEFVPDNSQGKLN